MLAVLQIVSPSSAQCRCGSYRTVDTDHIRICKPLSQEDGVYRDVLERVLHAADTTSKRE